MIQNMDLDKKIIQQLEYYFGDINLPRDKFLKEKIKEDDGWVTMDVMLTFKRLASLSTDPEVIAKAIEKSDSHLVVVSEDHKKIRRNPEMVLPELTDERKLEMMKRSAYVKGFPTDETMDNILNFLEPYGPYDSVIRRTTKDHKFKGSCFVVFKDVDTCKKFIELEELKYKDTELIRKWQNGYLAEKRQQIEERKKSKKERKQAAAENAVKEEAKQIEFPKGAIIHFTGIEEGKSLTREEVKEKLNEAGGIELAYIDFNKGDVEGYARLPTENGAVEFCKKVTEVEVDGCKLKLRVLEGDEETEYLKKTSEAMVKMRQNKKGNFGKKRKGNFGNHNRNAKAKKTE